MREIIDCAMDAWLDGYCNGKVLHANRYISNHFPNYGEYSNFLVHGAVMAETVAPDENSRLPS